MPNPPKKPPRKKTNPLGQIGEDLALEYLLSSLSHRLVKRNYKCFFGEIDLITKRNSTLHFVEVKTRSNLEYGQPHTALSMIKLSRLNNSIRQYIKTHPEFQNNFLYQLDLVTVLHARHKSAPEIQYYPQIDWT